MTTKRPESISEDWQELDTVGSVVSFDGSSRSTSPAPLEAQTPAIVSSTLQGSQSTEMRLPLRPKDDETIESPLSSTTTAPILDAEKSVAPSESQSSQPLQNVDTNSRSQYLTASIARETGDLPLSWNGREWILPPSDQEQKELWWDDSVPDLQLGYDQGRRDEKLDPIDNPRAYHEACTDAMTSLTDVAKLAHDIGGHRISTMSHIRQICERLSIQIKELKRMLKTYAKYWMAQGSKGNVADIPLNPDVWELLAQLRKQLLRTAAELRGAKPEEGVALQVPDMPLHVNLTLARCGEGLEDISASFAAFMPIMRADYDMFRTKHMDFQVAPTSTSRRVSRRIPPNPTVSRVRQELYALKDSLASMSAFLKELNSNRDFDWVIDPAVTNSADAIVEVITKTLTNNPSEWMDSDTTSQQGGFTYTQFVELDDEILHEIVLHLKAHQNELDSGPDPDQTLYSSKMVREHQVYLLGHGGILEAIRSLVEFVKQLLLIP
ncbi:unnamed protein product [Fusarium langsethiae]|nr:unnamed protein product [Fusarium langsethiae]GKU22168.1 unnamed protein product [Fusarium langsethiae]